MKCQKCNTILDIDSGFCPNCGTRVQSIEQSEDKIITVGRGDSNSIVIRNPNVSSHHAQFKINSGTITLEDLNSSNGTYVNKKKIILAVVSRRDEIKFSEHYVFDWKEIEKYLSSDKNAKSLDTPDLISENFQTKSVLTIGRTSENDIVLNNIKVSRHHSKLERIGQDWYIEDLGSSNNTFVNGEKIKKQLVTPKDFITIGGVPLNLASLFQPSRKIQGDVKLTSKHLTFIVDNKTIVDDISLTILPGEFVGLIGPSGAGKTSLMLMMNGVVRPSSGDVFINSQSLFANFDSFKGQIGYVPQDDIIHRELKVEESLSYTAKLRFSTNYTPAEISTQVNTVIDTLDLNEARNTIIGTAERKGISGGQRKRVNLGQELLTEPSILFLDEPTSGLDPKTDMDVMNLLKAISDKGRIIVLTTHNITMENFEILSHLIVLTKGGKLAYYGPANKSIKYFNVSKPYEIFDTLNKQEANYWKEKYRASEYYEQYVISRQDTDLHLKSHVQDSKKDERKVDLKQFLTLTERYLKIKLRDKVSTLILLLQAPIIAILISLVFSKPDEKTSALFVLVIAAIWLGCSNASREIVSEQSIYKRERMVNLKIPSYLFSKISVLSLLCVLQSSILAGIVTPALHLEIGFVGLVIILLVTSIASLSIGLFISSLVNTNEASMGLIPIVLIPQVILGGLISKFGDMSDFIKTLSALMISRWSFEGSLIGEFGIRSNQMIQAIGFDQNNLVIDYTVIIFFSLMFLFLTVQSLKRKDNKP